MKTPRIPLFYDFLLKFAGMLTAVSVAIATLGIPLPLPFVKDTSVLFPCMSCGCGCVNAEMCWRDCCCYTNIEKLAWANEQGIKAPAYLVAQVATESSIDDSDSELADLKPCCRKRALAARQASCCSNKSECGDGPEEADAPPLPPGVLAIHALKCQGNSLSLSLLPPTISTDQIGTELPLLPQESVLITEPLFYQPPTFAAVVPPPEFAV